ncbi:MAG: hypothetical protein RIR18_536 [Pseudomonadota bacterium]|jgi:iron complex outermembrane receptor protein
MNNPKLSLMTLALASVFAPMSFAIAAEDTELAPVITSASRTERLVTDVPVAAFVIDRKDIEKRNVSSLEEIIDRVPGVNVSRTKGMNDAAPTITLRGVPSSKRSLIMLDGVPVNDGYAGSQKMMGLAVENIQNVEVILGPSSSLYGNNAMGGVVSYTSRMPETEELRYSIGYGDSDSGDRGLNQLQRVFLSYGKKFDTGLKLLASISESSAAGAIQDFVTGSKPASTMAGWQQTQTPAGAATYILGDKGLAPATIGETSLKAEYDLGGADKLRFNYTKGFQNILNSEPNPYLTVVATGASTYNNAEKNYLGIVQQTERQFISAGLDKRVGESMVKAKIAHVITDYWYTTSYGTGATYNGGGAAQKVYNPSTMNFADIQTNTPINDKHVLTWGATFQQDEAGANRYNLSDWKNTGNLTGAKVDNFEGKTETLGFFVQDEWAISSKTTAFLGARQDNWTSTSGSAYVASPAVNETYASRQESSISPRMGIVHNASPSLTVRASAGSAFRAPNVFDLYRPFPTTSATGTYTGNNPNLKPETMNSVDFGTDAGLWEGAILKATVYYNRFSDMMYNMPIGLGSTAAAQSICPGITTTQNCVQKTNVGSAESQGVEIMLTQRFNQGLMAYLGATKMNSKILKNETNPDSEGKQFTLVPHETATLGMQYQKANWMGNLAAKYQGRMWGSSDDTNTQKTWGVLNTYNAITTVDTKISYRFSKEASLSFAVNNLLDTKAYNYNPIYGRSWFLQLSGQF